MKSHEWGSKALWMDHDFPHPKPKEIKPPKRFHSVLTVISERGPLFFAEYILFFTAYVFNIKQKIETKDLQSSHYSCAAAAGSLRLKTDFTATVFNFAKRNELFPPVATHRSILWLVTSGLRRLQDIAKKGRWAFVFLLIGTGYQAVKSYNNLLYTTGDIRHDVNGAWLASMHMVGKCPAGSMDASWPSIWYGLFVFIQWVWTSLCLLLACCSSVFWGISSLLFNFCLSHSWHSGLLSSWIAKRAAASFQSLRPACLRQTPSFRNSCPREFFVFTHFNHVQNARCSTPRRMFERARNSGSCEIIR